MGVFPLKKCSKAYRFDTIYQSDSERDYAGLISLWIKCSNWQKEVFLLP